jgi:hypothetical protein
VLRKPCRINLLDRIGDIVFGPFDARDECAFAAGDDEMQPLPRPAKRRLQLGAVLDRDPGRGAGADINQPSALAECLLGRVGRG